MLDEDEKPDPAQKYTCCKAEENKPEWCSKSSDDDSDDGEGRRGKKDDGSRDKRGKKRSFKDEVDKEWTRDHKRLFMKWRKSCDCRPLPDGTITTWLTCEGNTATSVECPFGITDNKWRKHCRDEEDDNGTPESIVCESKWYNRWYCKSRCPAEDDECDELDRLLTDMEEAEDTAARAGWREACGRPAAQ